ncbi:unnamed protein product [Choristocarpus tenellus]
MLSSMLFCLQGYVPLPSIVKKVLADHAGNSLGEFRDVIVAMLDTYTYDTNIHRTAASLLFDNLRNAVKERQALKGAGVRIAAIAGHELPGPPLDPSPTDVPVSSSLWTERQPSIPMPAQPPEALLETLGSGVISVRPGRGATVELIGQEEGLERGHGGLEDYPSKLQRITRKSDGVYGDVGVNQTGEHAVGVGDVTATSARAAAMLQQREVMSGLWRLKAARKRRQKRDNKLRIFVESGWDREEDATFNAAGGRVQTSRADTGESATASRFKTSAMGWREKRQGQAVPPSKEVGELGDQGMDGVEQTPDQGWEGNQGQGQQGWGMMKLPLAAGLVIPSSLRPKRL